MGAIKVYLKNGRRTGAEANLANSLQKEIEKRIAENPDFAKQFRPAQTLEQLKNLHKEYCVEDAVYQNVDTDVKEEKTSIFGNSNNKKPEVEFDDNDTFIDPMNREEPIIRDYVQNGGFADSGASKKGIQQTSFAEPLSEFEAFDLPSDDEPNTGGGQPNKGGNTQGGNNNNGGQKKPEKKPPLNPEFDDMSSGKKKRSTKKFAGYIVDAVCMLLERGFVWYTTKDINEAKLAEYELNDEMDLTILLNLENGQEVTVKQFFLLQAKTAEQLAVIDEQEKKDLAEALAEVLMEKGFAPTPTQEALLIGVKMVAGKFILAMTITGQNNAMLNQLRVMHQEGGAPRQPQYQQPPQREPDPIVQQQQQNIQPEDNTIEDDNAYYEQIMAEVEPAEIGGIVEKPLQTIE
jgi:hypothetical protein